MKETELKSLLEQRPQFSSALVESLDDALSRLEGCVHFHQYRGVPLRNFLSGTSGTFEPISQEPLQDICERGAVKICEHPSLEVGNVRALVMLINHLAEVDPLPPRAEQMPEIVGDISAESTQTVAASTQLSISQNDVEDRGAPSIASPSDLEASKGVVSLQQREAQEDTNPTRCETQESRVSAETKITTAPSAVGSDVSSPSNIKDKLTHNAENLQAAPSLARSQMADSSDKKPKMAKEATNVLSELVRVSSTPQAPAGAALEFFPSYARILVSHLRDLSARGGSSPSSPFISSLLERVSQSLRDEELVVFWFSSEHGIEPVEALFGVSQEWTLACHAKVREIVTRAVEVLAPNIIEAITLGLHAPIIPLNSLLRCLDADPDDTVSVIVGKMVLCAFGAREGIFREAPIRGLWSVQERVVHILIDAVLSLLPTNDEVTQRELKAIFPVLDSEQRLALITRFATYDETCDRWSRLAALGS